MESKTIMLTASLTDGIIVGPEIGRNEGVGTGPGLGSGEVNKIGYSVGVPVGGSDGCCVGTVEGSGATDKVGFETGTDVGNTVGAAFGSEVGAKQLFPNGGVSLAPLDHRKSEVWMPTSPKKNRDAHELMNHMLQSDPPTFRVRVFAAAS